MMSPHPRWPHGRDPLRRSAPHSRTINAVCPAAVVWQPGPSGGSVAQATAESKPKVIAGGLEDRYRWFSAPRQPVTPCSNNCCAIGQGAVSAHADERPQAESVEIIWPRRGSRAGISRALTMTSAWQRTARGGRAEAPCRPSEAGAPISRHGQACLGTIIWFKEVLEQAARVENASVSSTDAGARLSHTGGDCPGLNAVIRRW